jgi:hypothetical protein
VSLRFLYAHPGDEWASLLTPTVVGGSADPDFPVANLAAMNPALPFKFTGTAGRLRWDRTTAKALGLMACVHCNFDGTASILASDASDFSTGESYPLTLPAADTEGYYDAPWLDLSAAPHRRYVGLDVAGNSQPIIIGLPWFASTTRTLANNPQWKFTQGAIRPRVPTLQTVAGVSMTFRSYGRRRFFGGALGSVPDATRDAVDAWQQAAGGQDLPFLIVPDADVPMSSWFVRWATSIAAGQLTNTHQDFNYSGEFLDVNTLNVGWLEVAKGRPWGSV